MPKLEYRLVSGDTENLAFLVEDAALTGWRPQGGVAIHHIATGGGPGHLLYQAMIREARP